MIRSNYVMAREERKGSAILRRTGVLLSDLLMFSDTSSQRNAGSQFLQRLLLAFAPVFYSIFRGRDGTEQSPGGGPLAPRPPQVLDYPVASSSVLYRRKGLRPRGSGHAVVP